MENAAKIANLVPYSNKKILLVDRHTTDNIVDALERYHNVDQRDYKKLAPLFWDRDAHHTAKRLYKFCRDNIRYNIEHPDNQASKSPGAILAQRHGDCKHYASFINGVCNALRNEGYPVDSYYRFVSDSPNEEVHHVFAVVTDGHRSWWVDPVLTTFNAQPVFHNVKDLHMSAIGKLYRISGTDQNGRPTNLPMVGKKKKNNIFRQAAKAIKKVEHGAEVNLHNAGKEIKKGADKVKNVVLKVSMAPARNAFMALVDLNAFNLATRLGDAWAQHGAAIRQKWVDIGGDPNKLRNAINNGRKHKAYYHHTAVKKISGPVDVEQIVSGVFLVKRLPRHKPHMRIDHLRHAYHMGEDGYGRMPVVSGIGEPISIGALTALAGALIGIFSKWLKPDKGDKNATDVAKAGIANIVQNASDAIDMGNDEKAAQLMNVAKKGSEAVRNIQMNAGTDENGNPVLEVSHFDHPQLQRAGTDQAYNQPAPPDYQPNVALPADVAVQSRGDKLTDDITAHPAKIVSDVGEDLKQWAHDIWAGYKTPILFAGGGVLIYSFMNRKKRR